MEYHTCISGQGCEKRYYDSNDTMPDGGFPTKSECESVCPTYGTCCKSDGTCSFVVESDCQGGTWQPRGSCDPNPCPQPMGACCSPYYGCYQSTQGECWAGSWIIGANCTDDPCPPPTGACCDGGSCSDGVAESDCGGVWQGIDSMCSEGGCDGTCCVPQEGGCSGMVECGSGYFASKCAELTGGWWNSYQGNVGCDSTGIQPPPPGSNPNCAGGQPTSVTITVSGVQPLQPSEQYLADAINKSFTVNFDTCSGSGSFSQSWTQTLTDPNTGETLGTIPWTVRANASFSNSGWSAGAAIIRDDIRDYGCGGIQVMWSGMSASGSFSPAGTLCNGVVLASCTAPSGPQTPNSRNTTYPCFGGQYYYTQVVDTSGATISISAG